MGLWKSPTFNLECRNGQAWLTSSFFLGPPAAVHFKQHRPPPGPGSQEYVGLKEAKRRKLLRDRAWAETKAKKVPPQTSAAVTTPSPLSTAACIPSPPPQLTTGTPAPLSRLSPVGTPAPPPQLSAGTPAPSPRLSPAGTPAPPPQLSAGTPAPPATIILPTDELCSDASYSDAPPTQVKRQDDHQDLIDKLEHVETELSELRNTYREMMALKDETIQMLHDQIKEMPAMILSQLHQQLMQPP